MTISPIPRSILTQCTYIMSRYSVALLLPTNSSNNYFSGLQCCLAGLIKPTWKDSGRHNHFTSSASSSSLWSCCTADHYSKGRHCCLALYSISVLFVYTAAFSTVGWSTICIRYVSVIMLSLACFYLICLWLRFAFRLEAIFFFLFPKHPNPWLVLPTHSNPPRRAAWVIIILVYKNTHIILCPPCYPWQPPTSHW